MNKPLDEKALKPCPFCGGEMHKRGWGVAHARGDSLCPLIDGIFSERRWNKRAFEATKAGESEARKADHLMEQMQRYWQALDLHRAIQALRAICDYADYANKDPREFVGCNVDLLTGPIFDEARMRINAYDQKITDRELAEQEKKVS